MTKPQRLPTISNEIAAFLTEREPNLALVVHPKPEQWEFLVRATALKIDPRAVELLVVFHEEAYAAFDKLCVRLAEIDDYNPSKTVAPGCSRSAPGHLQE